MYKKIGTIIYSCSSFGSKLKEHDLSLGNSSGNSNDINNFLKFFDKLLDNSNSKANEIRKKLEDIKGNGK